MSEEPGTILQPQAAETAATGPADLENFGQPEKKVQSEPGYIQARFAHLEAIYNLDYATIATQREQNPALKHNETLGLYQLLVIKKRLEENPEDEQARSKQALMEILYWIEEPPPNHPQRTLAIKLLGNFPQRAKRRLMNIFHYPKDKTNDPALAFKVWADLDPEFKPPTNLVLTLALSREEPAKLRSQALSEIVKRNHPEAWGITQELRQDREAKIRAQAALELANFGQQAWPVLESLAKDEDDLVKRNAFIAMTRLGKKSKRKVRRIITNRHTPTPERIQAAIAYGTLGLEAFPFLKRQFRKGKIHLDGLSPNLWRFGPQALPLIRSLISDSDNPKELVHLAQQLQRSTIPPQNTLPELRNIQQKVISEEKSYEPLPPKVRKERGKPLDNGHYSGPVDLMIVQTRLKEAFKKDPQGKERLLHALITRQDPILANPLSAPFLADVERSLIPVLTEAVDHLKTDFPEIVGLKIVGSLAKGYWLKTSDLDIYPILASKDGREIKPDRVEAIHSALKEKINLPEESSLCSRGLIQVDFSRRVIEKFANLFHPAKLALPFDGVFIGDQKRLAEIRIQFLEKFEEPTWEKIRQTWQNYQEINFYKKLVPRFNLSPLEGQLVLGLREFLWSLPDRETMVEACQEQVTPS
ncbi:HEAT repeat domain-containing protein [Patescibacteria group bacterium]